MKLRDAIKYDYSNFRTYNIGFNDGDETQLSGKGLKDLEEAWSGFCADCGLEETCVEYVKYVRPEMWLSELGDDINSIVDRVSERLTGLDLYDEADELHKRLIIEYEAKDTDMAITIVKEYIDLI